MMEDLYKKYGEVFRVPVLHRNFTFLLSPEVSERFYKGLDNVVSQKEVYEFNVPTFGKGVVFDVDVRTRGEQFRLLKDNLKSHMLRSYVDMMVQEATAFFDKWGDGGVVDLLDKLPELVVLTASRTLLGKEVRESLFEKVAKLVHDLDDGMIPLSVVAPYLPIPPHRQRDRARKELGEIFGKVIRARRARGTQEKDLLQALIDAHYQKSNDGRALTEEEITGMLIATLFAGQHTSSITSVWAGMHMVHSPTDLESAIQEQLVIIEKHGDELTFEALNDMDVLHRCIKEALRLHPPLMMLMRHVHQSFEITTSKGEKYVIPKGETVVTSPSFLHRRPSVFEDPDQYKPKRFEKENAYQPFSFQAFGGGRHHCLGETFAFMQIKVIWSLLLRRFAFEPHVAEADFPLNDYDAMVVGPDRPCTVRFNRRDISAAKCQ